MSKPSLPDFADLADEFKLTEDQILNAAKKDPALQQLLAEHLAEHLSCKPESQHARTKTLTAALTSVYKKKATTVNLNVNTSRKPPSTLTATQRERIRKNKEEALAIKKKESNV